MGESVALVSPLEVPSVSKSGGSLSLRSGVREGCTRILEQRQTAPLKVTRPWEGRIGDRPGLDVCVMEAAPGLLDGDHYRYHWHLEADATLRVTTQGATRAHPARKFGTRITTRLDLAPGARLFYVPEATVLYRDANLTVDTRAELGAGAVLVYLDVVAAGRIARGERFDFTKYEGRLNARCEGAWLACARQRCVPGELSPTRPGAWSQFTHWGTLYALGTEVDDRWLAAARSVLPEEQEEPGPFLRPAAGARFAASRLPGGIAVALLGGNAYELRARALQVISVWETLLVASPADSTSER